MTETPDPGVAEELFSFESGSPVRGTRSAPPRDAPALALSGGGYRAMLFHVGVVLRVNEAGLLGELDRISSVSGGSITSGVLAKAWPDLVWEDGVATNLEPLLVDPLRRLADTKIDVPAVLTGLASPFATIAERVERKLDKLLFDGMTLADLPSSPRFVFNATNLETGVLFRFHRDYLGDYRVGRVLSPRLPLAAAVTASAAFPPFLSPYELDGSELDWVTDPGNDLTDAGYRDDIFLSDGGVYDNLALESVWKQYRTVLISDAGGHLQADDDPDRDWPRLMLRVLRIMDAQVRALRRRIVVDAFARGDREGIFVSTVSRLDSFPNGPHLPVDPEVTARLAAISTRLAPLPEEDQMRLINWGYAATDAALRGYLRPGPPGTLPYPQQPLG